MKAAVVIVVGAFIGACLLMRFYTSFGWHYFTMPFPDLIAPTLHLGGEAHYDAAEAEIWLEFFAALLIAFTGIRWASRNPSN